jgi:CheY-like chemotaxis protein
MDAIGKLTGGVAHDFNNMLTVVIGSLDRLRRQLADDPQKVKRVDLALEGATRCADLTRQLLAFSRQQALQARPVDLNAVVATINGMVRRILGERIELSVTPSNDLWPARTDPTQVESALINLVVNARDAMPEGGKLSIATRNVPRTDPVLEELCLSKEDYIALLVADTGVGIPPDLIERVFDPFFTTKEAGKGTGLGLSIIYGFVKQSGGHIRLESEPGHGTRATIYLPRSLEGAKAKSDGEAERTTHRARAKEVVLAVEDDPAVRGFALETLKELGYQVLEAADGDAAMSVLSSGEHVDLLFTDFAMPGSLNGRELARKVNARQPSVKVLLTSAYTDQFVSDAKARTPLRFLRKPYRVDELAEAVRQALDES